MIDNSGIEFFYTSTRRQHDAGILTVGHQVNRFMIIPPNTESYSIVGECSADCTNAVRNSSINFEIAAARYLWQLMRFCQGHGVYSMHACMYMKLSCLGINGQILFCQHPNMELM